MRERRRAWVSFLISLLLVGAAVGWFSSKHREGERAADLPASPPRVPPQEMQGTWCIATNPLVHDYLLEKHAGDELRARMREVRKLDAVRIAVQGTSISITDSSPVGRVDGTMTVELHGGERYLHIDWQSPEWPKFFPPGNVTTEVYTDAVKVMWGGQWYLEYFLMPTTSPFCVATENDLVLGTATSYRPPPATDLPIPSWIAQAPTEWPQIVLTNQATFHGSSRLQGASSFLIDVDGQVYAATAKHLIGENGGVEPEIALAHLDDKLQEWRLYVRTRPTPFVRATRLTMKDLVRAATKDWLFMDLETNDKAKLPAMPLVVRRSPVQLNERVYLIGCEYQDYTCRQAVYEGRIAGRTSDYFRIELKQSVQIRGFSGAPMVDADGHLVGVMTIQFEPFTIGEDYLEAGGQDASLGIELFAAKKK